MTRQEQIQQRLDQMPVSCRRAYKKAVEKRSMRAALDSFCLECVGYQREEIKVLYRFGMSAVGIPALQNFSRGSITPLHGRRIDERGLRGIIGGGRLDSLDISVTRAS